MKPLARNCLGLVIALLGLAPLCLSEPSPRPIREYVHSVWRTEEGLPQNSVQVISQTKDGYIWLGTQEGLVRFNGKDFAVFNKSNVEAIRHNDVRGALEDRNGALGFGTYAGVVVREKNGQFRGYSRKQGLSDNFVNALLEDRNGDIWIGTDNGLNKFRHGSFVPFTTRDGLSDANINALLQDHDGNLWVATNRGLDRFQQGTVARDHVQEYFPGRVIKSLYQDRSGALWVGTDQDGLYVFRGAEVVHHEHSQGLPKAPILSIIQDYRNSIWVGTAGGGVCRLFQPGAKYGWECYDSRQGLSGDLVIALYEDAEKSIWVGTETGGLNRFKEGPITTFGGSAGFKGAIRSIYEAKDGSLWVGSDDGLRRSRGGQVSSYITKKGPANNYAWAVTGDRKGQIWVGTNGGGVNVFNGNAVKTYTTKDGLADNQIHALLEDHDGNMWIGTERNGVSVFGNGRFETYNTHQGLANNRVWAILEDHNRNIWIGTDNGLSRFDHGKFDNIDFQNSPGSDGITGGVTYLYEDSSHILWIGTYGGGLKRLDKSGRLTTYTKRDGLFDESVWTILEDGKANLWMSSNLGVYSVSKSELNAFAEGRATKITSVAFGKADGMLGSECNGGSQNSGWKTATGTLLFPCVEGIVAVTPEKITRNPLPPPVVIEEAIVNEEETTLSHVVAPAGRGELEFTYAALSYRSPEKVMFQYKLEGFDKDWVLAGQRRTAFYTNIPPGQYRFRVIAANEDGVWNTVGATFDLELKPRFYQTKVFYAVCLLVLLAMALLIVDQRTRSLHKRQEELLAMVSDRTSDLQHEIEERKKIEADLQRAKEAAETATNAKSEFLANMSHEIRTPLNGVIGMIDLTRQTQLNLEQNEFLKMAADSAGALLTVINDILDFSKIEAGKLELECEQFDLPETITNALACVALIAHQKGLELTCSVAPETPQFVMGDSARIRQVLINLLGNAVKFTESGNVDLRLELQGTAGEEHIFKFSVADTGIGIPEEKRQSIFEAFSQADNSVTRKYGGTGLGLAISSRMIRLMGGAIEVESAVGLGSVFSFAARFGRVMEDIQQPGSRMEFKGMRVLVVDDNLINRRILIETISSWGALPVSAESGRAGLSAMIEAWQQGRPFPLVLVDCRMPEIGRAHV